MQDLLDPRVDVIFKRIFGSEHNKDVLLAFLNSTFREAGEPPLTEIVLLNPYTEADSPDDNSQDAAARMAYDARMKALSDEKSRIEGALEEGMAKGIEKGIMKGKAETAIKLLALGIDIQTIAEATGMTREEIEALRQVQ
jgi:hypothetical protein